MVAVHRDDITDGIYYEVNLQSFGSGLGLGVPWGIGWVDIIVLWLFSDSNLRQNSDFRAFQGDFKTRFHKVPCFCWLVTADGSPVLRGSFLVRVFRVDRTVFLWLKGCTRSEKYPQNRFV